MGFDNKNSYWIDSFIKKYEESFKKVDLLNRKSEYWRFASPSIWYDNYINKNLPSEKQIESFLFDYDVMADCSIKFKDGILDISSLSELNKDESYEEIDTRLASGWYVDSVENNKKKKYRTKKVTFKISKKI